MLLISPTNAALAIGAKCGGSAPTADDAAMLTILNFITPRVEDALNVESLTLEEHIDHFRLPAMNLGTTQLGPRITLRLNNGFVVPDSVVVTGPDGTEIDADIEADIDYIQGLVHLFVWGKGTYKVSYAAGFEPETEPEILPDGYDTNQRVLQDVPEWIKAIAVAALVTWYRMSFLSPKASKDLSYAQVQNALQREIATRVYSRYMRPRQSVVFGESRGHGY